jgi:hypothetical protein
MTDWKEVVLQSREAELGVTGEGIIDPETDKVITDPSILAPIYQRGRAQMRVTSNTGAKLLEMVK